MSRELLTFVRSNTVFKLQIASGSVNDLTCHTMLGDNARNDMAPLEFRVAMKAVLLAMLLGVGPLGCKSRPVAAGASASTFKSLSTAEVSASATSPSADSSTAVEPCPPAVQLALCGKSKPCSVKAAFPAIRRSNGDSLLVVSVTPPLMPMNPNRDKPQCKTHEVWLVRTNTVGAVVDRQLVAAGCAPDTPFGEGCDRTPLIYVVPRAGNAPSSVTVSWQNPGPGCDGWWRGNGELEIALDSFSPRRSSEWSGRAAAPDDSTTRDWDFSALSFKSEWTTDGGDCKPRNRGPYFGIPRLTLDRGFLDEAWRTAKFDQCATPLDAAHGVTLPGDDKSAAVLHAVISDAGALFVDVIEAPEVMAGAALQVCFASWNAHSYDYCHDRTRAECVRMTMDGKRLSGSAAIERAPASTRFRVQLPPKTNAISVSYIETKGRSISSSDFRKGDITSLGAVFPISTEVASCKLVAGQLQFSFVPRQPDHLLLDFERLD